MDLAVNPTHELMGYGLFIDGPSRGTVHNPASVIGQDKPSVLFQLQFPGRGHHPVGGPARGQDHLYAGFLHAQDCLFCMSCDFLLFIGQCPVDIQDQQLILHTTSFPQRNRPAYPCGAIPAFHPDSLKRADAYMINIPSDGNISWW